MVCRCPSRHRSGTAGIPTPQSRNRDDDRSSDQAGRRKRYTKRRIHKIPSNRTRCAHHKLMTPCKVASNKSIYCVKLAQSGQPRTLANSSVEDAGHVEKSINIGSSWIFAQSLVVNRGSGKITSMMLAQRVASSLSANTPRKMWRTVVTSSCHLGISGDSGLLRIARTMTKEAWNVK